MEKILIQIPKLVSDSNYCDECNLYQIKGHDPSNIKIVCIAFGTQLEVDPLKKELIKCDHCMTAIQTAKGN